MFWERFYDLCCENDTSPTKVVTDLGLAISVTTKWKKGVFPGGENLLKISDYFDVSVDYLLGISDVKEKATPKEQPLSEMQKAAIRIVSELPDYVVENLIGYIDFLKKANKM